MAVLKGLVWIFFASHVFVLYRTEMGRSLATDLFLGGMCAFVARWFQTYEPGLAVWLFVYSHLSLTARALVLYVLCSLFGGPWYLLVGSFLQQPHFQDAPKVSALLAHAFFGMQDARRGELLVLSVSALTSSLFGFGAWYLLFLTRTRFRIL